MPLSVPGDTETEHRERPGDRETERAGETKMERKKERERKRQTDRDRQTDRQTEEREKYCFGSTIFHLQNNCANFFRCKLANLSQYLPYLDILVQISES